MDKRLFVCLSVYLSDALEQFIEIGVKHTALLNIKANLYKIEFTYKPKIIEDNIAYL